MIETTVFEREDVAVLKVSQIRNGKVEEAGFQVRLRGTEVGPLFASYEAARRKADVVLLTRRRTTQA